MTVNAARPLPDEPFMGAEVGAGLHANNDRNAAFVCRYAGPPRRRRRAVGNAARRAPDRCGVLQRLVHRAVPDREPEALRRAHAACTFETATGQRRDVGPGDILLIPFADAHKFRSGSATDIAYIPDLVQP